MDKKGLLNSAKQLSAPSAEAQEEYSAKAEVLIANINKMLLDRADIDGLISSNSDMMKDNHANHVRFMISVFADYQPEVLVDTVLWVFRAYRSHGFTTNYWAAQMNAWLMVLKEHLSDTSFAGIRPFYIWFQVNIPMFVLLSDEELQAHQSMH